MGLFYIGLIIIFVGLGVAAWLLFSEKQGPAPSAVPADFTTDDQPQNSFPKETTEEVLRRLGLEGGPPPQSDSKEKEGEGGLLENLFKRFKFGGKTEKVMAIASPPPETPIFPPSYPTSFAQEVASIQPPTYPNNSIDVFDLKEKYDRLDRLFQEKSQALEKSEKALANEVRNRKEFNKVKDLLEKEIKTGKERYREIQIELGTSQTETHNFKSRVIQLEAKVTKLEKTMTDLEHILNEKDHKIVELNQKIQFAAASQPPESVTVAPVENIPTEPITESTPEPAAPGIEAIVQPVASEPAPEPMPIADQPIIEPPPQLTEFQDTEPPPNKNGFKLPPDILSEPKNDADPEPNPNP